MILCQKESPQNTFSVSVYSHYLLEEVHLTTLAFPDTQGRLCFLSTEVLLKCAFTALLQFLLLAFCDGYPASSLMSPILLIYS